MGLTISNGNDAVDAINSKAIDFSWDNGERNGISESEYNELAGMVADLSDADRASFDSFNPMWTGNRGDYSAVMNALKEGKTFNEFVRSRQ